MNLHKKRRHKLCIIFLFIFLEIICSGCGKMVTAEEMQAAREGYRRGNVSEEYYRLTAAAFRAGDSFPPATTIGKMGYRYEKILRYCFMSALWWENDSFSKNYVYHDYCKYVKMTEKYMKKKGAFKWKK